MCATRTFHSETWELKYLLALLTSGSEHNEMTTKRAQRDLIQRDLRSLDPSQERRQALELVARKFVGTLELEREVNQRRLAVSRTVWITPPPDR